MVVVVDAIGVILRAIPRENLEEGAEQGDVSPRCVEEDGAPQRVMTDEVLQLQLEGRCHVLYPERQV
jgi:hypothetical protein